MAEKLLQVTPLCVFFHMKEVEESGERRRILNREK